MATEARQPAPAAGEVAGDRPSKDRKASSDKKSTQAAAAAASSSSADATADKKLSGAELKKKKQEEKQARRAQAKASQAPQAAVAAAAQAIADGAKTGGQNKAKQKQDGQAGGAGGAGGAAGGAGSSSGAAAGISAHPQYGKAAPAAPPKDAKPSVPECFSHLAMAKRIGLSQADKDVHPTVLALGQQMATLAIGDSITRLEATLLAFKKVINSYTTPHNTTLSRHFTSHVLNPQIVYLTACRPMCFSMGNAIRWLKLQISKIDIDTSDSDAKKDLSESIDSFINERVTLADLVIVKTAADMIAPSPSTNPTTTNPSRTSSNASSSSLDECANVILTYAHHHLVERTLLRARAAGKRFRVILVDDPWDRAGLAHAKRLAAAGIPVAYTPDFGALRTNLQEATTVLVAAEAMFSNGAMYARAGTSDIASAASDLGVRVISLCETINFTERVSIDSLTYNEIDPERNTEEAFRLLFDTTRDKHISAIVTELGICAAKSVPSIMRKFDEL